MKRNIEFKVGLFVTVSTLIVIGLIGYTAYKKDVFAKIHTLTLSSKTGDDLSEGMPVLYSGFKIGNVQSLELNKEGVVIIKINVPERHVHWLRKDSLFIVDKPLIGPARLIVSTPDLKSPPLPPGYIPEVITIDNVSEIVKQLTPLVEKVKKIATQVEEITAQIASPQGEVKRILSNTERVTARFAQKDSLLEMAISDQESIKAVHDSLRKTREITRQVDAILKKADTMMLKADESVFGKDGAMPLVNRTLQDTLKNLEKVSLSLDHVNKMTSDLAESTTNIKTLRQEVDNTVNTISNLVNELGKKIPFRRQPEIKLP